MCKSKPGPRCSGHVGQQRERVRIATEQIAARIELVAGTEPLDDKEMSVLQRRKFALARQEQTLNVEWDETPEGRAELVAQAHVARTEERQAEAEIAASAFAGQPAEADARARARRARAHADEYEARERAGGLRYMMRNEALACWEAGDAAGEAITLRHGAGSAWLGQSDLKDLALGRGRPGEIISVTPGRAVAFLDRTDETDDDGGCDSDGYDDDGYGGGSVVTTRGRVVVEQSVAVREDNTLVAGEHPRSSTVGLVVSPEDNDMVRAVRPLGSDQHEAPTVYAEVHNEDVEEMLGGDPEHSVDIDWDDAWVTRDGTGRPVALRTEGRLETIGFSSRR